MKMKPDKLYVSSRLRDIRLDLNLSISEFGDKIGVPKGTVNSWLRGLALPPKEKLLRIALLSNTSINYILWGKESEQNCVSCSSALFDGECLNCVKERKVEMINFFDMVNSKLFPMNEERKSLILRIISFELEEIDSKILKIEK